MKILCVIDSLGSGGAQRQLVNLAVGFKEKGHEVSFLVYHEINFFKHVLVENNINVHQIIEPNYLKRLLKMRSYIRKGGFDSVLSFLEAANFICEVASIPSRKWTLVVGERSANPAILKTFKLRIFRWFHCFADYVVANSHENLKMVYKINNLLPKSNGKVIYNMIDLNLWKCSSEYIVLKNQKFNLTIVASFGKVKNLDGLVEAVSLLPDNYKEKLQIRWYGKEHMVGYLDKIVKRIKSLKIDKIFLFYPPNRDIMKYMNEADAIGLFSFYEGLPNVICEGMALSKPIISTNISDMSLLVKNPNLLAEAHLPKTIAETIQYYMDLTIEQLNEEGKYNRLKAEELFNKNLIVNNYISLLKKEYQK